MGEVVLMNGGFFVHHSLDVDKPIYRCISRKHVPDIFKDKHLYFRNVTQWEDTWEIPSRFFKVSDEKDATYLIENANRISTGLYGTCWTDTTDSDALWRIYSGPQKEGVCIETTPRKLLKSIDFSFRSKSFVDGFIAPVRYEQLNDPNGQAFFSNDSEYYPRNMVPAFIKRKAFEHEREIRFLICAPHYKMIYPDNLLNIADDESCLFLPLKNLDFIDRLIADPRLSFDEFNNLKKDFSCYEKEIVKSTLYDTPQEIYDIILKSGSAQIGQMKKAQWWINEEFYNLNQE